MVSTSKIGGKYASVIKLVTNQGRFIKPCPGTPRYVCCGYHIINFAQGCTLGCTYCILDYYLDLPTPVVFGNQNQLIIELSETLQKRKDGLFRFGTGEFTDSLIFEDVFPIYDKLIPIIANSSNAILEIKTKTVQVEPLLHVQHKDRVIVSWSLNSTAIAKQEEKGAPGIDERIDAARRVEEHGYKLAFHFDPIIHYKGWEEGYRETIDKLFRKVDPKSIVYVSMGTLRFMPQMRDAMEEHGAGYLEGDFIRGYDGKMRYFRPLRTKMYRSVLSSLREHVPEKKVYLCMENSDVWKDVFGIEGMRSSMLAERLDQRCRDAFTDV